MHENGGRCARRDATRGGPLRPPALPGSRPEYALSTEISMSVVPIADSEATPAPADQTSIKVLVVDDDTSITEALVDFLTMMEIDASACNSAVEGMRAVIGDPTLTVVVSDVRMPGGDGVCFAADIAATFGNDRAVSVVLITAFTSAAVAAVADRQQIFGFLQKPFRPQALVELLRLAHEAALTRRQNSRAAGAAAPAVPAARIGTIPADLIQAVVAAIPAEVKAARRVCTLADFDDRVAENAGDVRDILSRIVEQVVGMTRNGTVLTLSALVACPGVEFRVAVTPTILGDLPASAEILDPEHSSRAFGAIKADIRRVGGVLSFAPHPTAVALTCSLTLRGGVEGGG
ncbi:MAG: response regulator [Alphaproteobacteria bacterium]|nr:response regulator [Alphaproteobacteria bacterium]